MKVYPQIVDYHVEKSLIFANVVILNAHNYKLNGMLMVGSTHTLNFLGYWREINVTGVPNLSGIYCVYTCTNNPQFNNINLKKLIYIGESQFVQSRIFGHERKPDWRNCLNLGEELCFSCASVNVNPFSNERKLIESALINYHKPECNINKPNYTRDTQIHIISNGACWGINPNLIYPSNF